MSPSPLPPFDLPLSARDVSARLAELYGRDPALERGVVHPVACARGATGQLHALRIGHAPTSACDHFLLQAVRARANAILTSSANLRAEPALVHDLVGPAAPALARYRRDVARQRGPVHLFILTRSGDLPAQHPVWNDGTHKHVLAPPQALERIRGRTPLGTRLVALDGGAQEALALVRGLGHATVSVEAGPSLARDLYGGAPIVDELCLSLYLSPLPELALAGALPADPVLFQGLVAPQAASTRDGWSFERRVRLRA